MSEIAFPTATDTPPRTDFVIEPWVDPVNGGRWFWRESLQSWSPAPALVKYPAALVVGNEPNNLRITGVTTPINSDPIDIPIGGYSFDGAGNRLVHWGEPNTWEVSHYNGHWVIQYNQGAPTYRAIKLSDAVTPNGLTGWTVEVGAGQPSVECNDQLADVVGQVGIAGSAGGYGPDGPPWFRWDGRKWLDDTATKVVNELNLGDMSPPSSNVVFSELTLKAPLDNPTFTGSVTASTHQATTTAGMVIKNSAGATLLTVGKYDATTGYSTGIAEGEGTTASGHLSHAEGEGTTASGYASHAGGTRAKAIHDGARVCTDGQNADCSSTTTNTLTYRFANGYRFLGGDAVFSGTVTAGQFIGAGTGLNGTAANLTAGTVTTINGRLTAGANVTISGAGTASSPYSIAASGGSTATPTENLGNYRKIISNTPFPSPNIFLFGDSMIGTSSNVMIASLQSTFGMSGQNLDVALTGSGAASLADSCNYWLNGITYPLTATGHTATLGTSGGSFAVLGNVLKLYYVIEPGAGTFQMQVSENGGAWTNEGAVVNAAGTLAGGIWTVTKTTIRASYRIQAVWVSGSTKIIGGRIDDTTRKGGKFYFVSNGSSAINNIDNAFLNTPAAIVNPIMADIAPNLCIMSHLDGATFVNTYQGGLQDKIVTGITSGGAPTPSWLIVGPPTSATSEAIDTLQAEQAEAQRLLAISRFDAFFDNRLWALPWSTSEARGLFTGGDKTHYSALAQEQWIPSMLSQMGLSYAKGLGPSKVNELSIGLRKLTYNTASGTLDLDGSLRIHGASSLILEDRTTPANQNDFGAIYYSNNILQLYGSGGDRWSFNASVGQANFYPTASTLATPNGDLGLNSNPWRSLFTGSFAPRYVAKTSSYTIGVEDHTIDVTSGSPTITLPTAANHSRTYTIANTGAGTVTMATTSSQLIDGAAPGTIAPGGRLKVQSTTTGWITIP